MLNIRSQISFILSVALLASIPVRAAPNVQLVCGSKEIALAVDALLLPIWRSEAYQFCSTYISIPAVTKTVATKLITTTAATVFPIATVGTHTLLTTVTTETLTSAETTETPLATEIVTEVETTETPLATFSSEETTATVTPLTTTEAYDTTATVTPLITVSITTTTSTYTPVSTTTVITTSDSPVPVKRKRNEHIENVDERGIPIPTQLKSFVATVLSEACSCISTNIPLKTTDVTATSTVKVTATSAKSVTATVDSPQTALATSLVTATAATVTEVDTTSVTATAPTSTITTVQYDIATAPTNTITDIEYEVATAPTVTITNVQDTIATAPVSVSTVYSTTVVPVCQSTPLPNWTFQNYNCEAWTVTSPTDSAPFCGLSGPSIYQVYIAEASTTAPASFSMKQTISVCPGLAYTFGIQYYMEFGGNGAGDIYVGGVHILSLSYPGNFQTVSATFTPTVDNPTLEIDISCTSNCEQMQFDFTSISVAQSFS